MHRKSQQRNENYIYILNRNSRTEIRYWKWKIHQVSLTLEVVEKKSINVKVEQWKVSNMKNREKKDWKKMSKCVDKIKLPNT